MTDKGTPEVTIVVVPREKWNMCEASLDSILADRAEPFRLVYVDGASPGPVRRMIDDRARTHGFEVIRTRRFLTPNEARLMGLARVTTPYVVFYDNDVVAAPGWLAAAMACARETGADVVGPLTCEGSRLHTVIHSAGGECGVKLIEAGGAVERHLYERNALHGREVERVRDRLTRAETELVEFHCVLARTEMARRPGIIDPLILNTREHIDFCMNVRAAGGRLWFEPGSVVTFVHDTPLRPQDWAYFMLRWGDAWERRSLRRVMEKWQLSTAGTLGHRLRHIGWRRRQYLIDRMARRISEAMPVGRLRYPTYRLVLGAERGLNAVLSAANDLRSRRGRLRA